MGFPVACGEKNQKNDDLIYKKIKKAIHFVNKISIHTQTEPMHTCA